MSAVLWAYGAWRSWRADLVGGWPLVAGACAAPVAFFLLAR